MEFNRDFSVEPFQHRKHDFRAIRERNTVILSSANAGIYIISYGQVTTNLNLNQTTKQNSDINNNKAFKNPPEIRNIGAFISKN